MPATDPELLAQYVRNHSQDAFTALASRYLNLVYSAAVRQVRSPHQAEEVCQSVFTYLAQNAAKLRLDTNLTAWLYQVTRHKAIDVIRTETRRQAREQIAYQMSAMNEPSADWTEVEPLLDEAMQDLDEPDRTAILLRYFENKSLREVGAATGATEDAAQKRVSRALQRLRQFFGKRKVTVGTGALAAMLSANAIQAAPPALITIVAGAGTLAAASISSSTAIAITKTIAMTTIQKSIVAVIITGAIAAGIYQTHRVSTLQTQVQMLEQQKHQQQQQQAELANRLQQLQSERDNALAKMSALAANDSNAHKNPSELLKLRGEVGRLRQENASIGSTSALSKATANPEAKELVRTQQKAGMSMLYGSFAKRAKLSPEQTEKLNDLLADHIMENVGHVTTMLRDKPDAQEIDRVFSTQDSALQQKVQELLGDDGAAQYRDYTKNLVSSLTAEQFKGMMTGDDAAKAEKSKQLFTLMQEEIQKALSDASLPDDYQTLPILNFRNIASESEAERNLKLLEEIYQRVTTRVGSFLSPEEIAKFQDFKNTAIRNNRSALALNRTMMAQISQ